MHKRVSVFHKKSFNFQRVSVFYAALNNLQIQNADESVPQKVNMALSEWWETRFPASKKSEKANVSDKVYATLKKMYAYLDRLRPDLRPLVCQAIQDHLGLCPEDKISHNYLLLDIADQTTPATMCAHAFRTYLQHDIWTDHAHVAVFEKLNVAAAGQGFARIEALRTILSENQDVAEKLRRGFSVFSQMGLDPVSVHLFFQASEGVRGFLTGCDRETVRVLCQHFPLVFSEVSLTSRILGKKATPEVEEAFLALRHLPVTEAQVDLLKTTQAAMLDLLSRAEYLSGETCSEGTQKLKELRNGLPYSTPEVLELIVCKTICPGYRPHLSDLEHVFLDPTELRFLGVELMARGFVDLNLPVQECLAGAQLMLTNICDMNPALVDRRLTTQSAFRHRGMDSRFSDSFDNGSHEEKMDDDRSSLMRRYSSQLSRVDSQWWDSAASEEKRSASRPPLMRRYSSHFSRVDSQMEDGMAFRMHALGDADADYIHGLLAERELFCDYVGDVVKNHREALEARSHEIFEDGQQQDIFFEELISFVQDIVSPLPFRNDLLLPFYETSLYIVENAEYKTNMLNCIARVIEQCNLNPTQQKEALCTLDTLFGKQETDPFETTPLDSLAAQAAVSPSELRFLFDLPTLPTKIDNAQKMYSVLYSLKEARHHRNVETVYQSLNLSGEEAVSQRLSELGRHVSDLLLSEGFTAIETQAMTKLRTFYGDSDLHIFTRNGALSAAIGLMPKEAIALQSLLSQDHPSFERVRDIFVYSGHGERFDADSGYTEGIPVISARTVAMDALRLRNVHLQIYTKALQTLLEDQSMDNHDRGLLLQEISAVQRDMHSSLMIEDLSGASVSKASLKAALGKKGNLAGTRDRMTALLSQMDSEDLRRLSPKAFLQQHTEIRLNTQNEWKQKVFEVGDTTSVITPANAAAAGAIRNCVMDERGYTGISCQSNATWTDAAANNQITELSNAQVLLFSGVRHAIVATQIDDITQKTEANDAKAKDLLRSALLQKLRQNKADNIPLDAPLSIHLVSISLVTPDDVRPNLESVRHPYHEREMLQEQTAALHRLQQLSQPDKEDLLREFQTEEGQPLFDGDLPALDIAVYTFNFGVNEWEQMGRANQRPMNATAMTDFLTTVRQLPLNHQHYTLIQQLSAQISVFFDDYQRLGRMSGKQPQPYAMPVMIATLAHLADASLLFNCKSGKDRTSLFDVKVKIFTHYLATRGGNESLLYFNRLEEAHADAALGLNTDEIAWLSQQQRFNRLMLFNSGNREVQEENTTAWGYKLEGENTARMFEVVFGIKNMAEVYGFSRLIEA